MTCYFISENFLADSDAESNIQRDAQEKNDRQKGLTVAFDPSAGPPEDAGPHSKVKCPEPWFLYKVIV